MGDSLADQLLKRTSSTPAEVLVGQVTDVSDAGAVTVTVGGADLVGVPVLASYLPTVGDSIAVVRQGQRVLILGAVTQPQPLQGKVTSAAGNTVVVSTSVGTVACPFLASYTPLAGDQVALLWSGTQPIVVGKLGAVIAPPAAKPKPAAPPSSVVTRGSTTFTALSSASFRGGWRDDTDDVIQGTAPSYPGQNSGAWFYGSRIKSSLAGATVTRCRIYLSRVSGGTYAAQTIHLWRTNANGRPAGNVGYVAGPYDVALAVGASGWFDLPVDVGQALVASGGGIGVQGASPYLRMAGPSTTGQAGAIRIDWSR